MDMIWLYKNIKCFRILINILILEEAEADKLKVYCIDFIDVLMKFYDKNIIVKYIVLICMSRKRKQLNKNLLHYLDENRVSSFSIFVKKVNDILVFNKLFLSNKLYRRIVCLAIGEIELKRVRILFHQYWIEKYDGEKKTDIKDMYLEEMYCRKFNDVQ